MTICKNGDCKKLAYFNYKHLRAEFCVTHKETEMVDVRNPKCFCGKVQPRWNFEGLRARFCKDCKSDGMIEPNRKLCKCGIRPTFNLIGLKAEYCNSCKTDEMVNVSDKRCFCGKLTSPCFNYFGLVGKYCFDCKLPDMVDVRNLRCECGKSKAGFNFDGLNPRFCSICKLEGMIDVIHKKCNCGKKQPTYNYDGLHPEYCSICKLSGMINVKQQLCFCGNAQPTYNYEGLIAQYCAKCKTDDMIDVKHLKCKTNLCNTRVEEKYEGYCFRCFIYTFPDKPISKNYKTKEFSVVEYITNEFPDCTWIKDKTVQDGCSKKRPDLLLDLGYQIIIVEIDENQHKKYGDSCDNKRLMILSQDLGHRPIIFIRFNPDDYINQQGDKINSCWSITKKTGMIKIGNNKEWMERLTMLKIQIEYWINPENKTNKLVEVIQLYYDQNI